MGTASSLTCAPEMPLYLGDPCPRKAVSPLVGASRLSQASLRASREQKQTVSRVHGLAITPPDSSTRESMLLSPSDVGKQLLSNCC